MTAESLSHVASVPVRFLSDAELPITRMEVRKHFDALTDVEKKYCKSNIYQKMLSISSIWL